MKVRVSRLVDLWSELFWLDYLAPLVAVGVQLTLIISGATRQLGIHWPDLDQRVSAYATGATVVSVIGGLSAVAVSVYLAAAGERARAARQHKGTALRRNWRALLVGMALSAGMCLLAQVVDGGAPAERITAESIFLFGIVLAATRFVRLLWLFNAIMRIADRDLADEESPPAPSVGARWRKKAG